MFLVLAYGNKIVGLHSSNPNLTMQGWLLRKFKPNQESTPSRPSMQDVDEELSRLCDRVGRLKIEHYTRVDQQHPRQEVWARVSRNTRMVFITLAGFQRSFLWQILWLTFGNTWGFAQVYVARWQAAPTVVGNENELGFGQLVPLFLLALPVLAAVEGYTGMLLCTCSNHSTLLKILYRHAKGCL